MERFQDRVVLVTGATGGIGTEICARLAAEGAVVVATDLQGTPLWQLIDQIGGTPHNQMNLDVSSESEWKTVVDSIIRTHGKLDVLVNNAAISRFETVVDEQLEGWQRVVDTDQTGTWFGMKHAGVAIERTGGGAIVNVCSILGSAGGFGNSFAYHAAKGAVRSMTKNAAIYWATRGVRVNSLHPGFVETAQLLERLGGSERHQGMYANTPMGRLGTAAEIAGCVAFLEVKTLDS